MDNKMLGTCIFRDMDGELKSIDMDKVVALVEIKNEENNMVVNFKTTENCTKEEEIKIVELMKENFDLE